MWINLLYKQHYSLVAAARKKFKWLNNLLSHACSPIKWLSIWKLESNRRHHIILIIATLTTAKKKTSWAKWSRHWIKNINLCHRNFKNQDSTPLWRPKSYKNIQFLPSSIHFNINLCKSWVQNFTFSCLIFVLKK